MLTIFMRFQMHCDILEQPKRLIQESNLRENLDDFFFGLGLDLEFCVHYGRYVAAR
jgi:hypothetical protein